MAGSGDLQCLRLFRMLHGRNKAEVTYGSHMAVHMAIGMLFIGAGTASFCTRPRAIAALLCAFYPIWPTSSTDNRGHLQAFRHLWVLALERRCLITRDVETGEICHVPIVITVSEGASHAETGTSTRNDKVREITTSTPCILPSLMSVKSIKSATPRYFPVCLQFVDDDQQFAEYILGKRLLWVKRKTGHLNYLHVSIVFQVKKIYLLLIFLHTGSEGLQVHFCPEFASSIVYPAQCSQGRSRPGKMRAGTK